jgi:hypothetical protein
METQIFSPCKNIIFKKKKSSKRNQNIIFKNSHLKIDLFIIIIIIIIT